MASNYNRRSGASGSRKSSPSARSARPASRPTGRSSQTNRSSGSAGAPRSRSSAPRTSGRSQQSYSSVRVGDIQQATRAHRVQKTYRRYVVRIAIALVLIIGLLVAGIAVYNSNLFTISNVSVKGVEHLTATEMTELASVPAGTTLLRVDEAGIKERLLQEAWVKEVAVNRVFPDTLELDITERTIAAIVEVPVENAQKTETWAIASDGIWLMNIPPEGSAEASTVSIKVYEDAASVLRITGVPYGLIPEVGSYCSDDNVNNALAIVDGFSTDLANQVKTVSATGTETTTLILDNGIEIAFGTADNIREKERVCLALMEEHPGQVTYINVRIVDEPTWRSTD